MARARTPTEKAKLTGAAAKDPQRYRDRKEPNGGPRLGKPPAYFEKAHRDAWSRFIKELPWLVESDRAMVEITCLTRVIVETQPNVSAAILREHRQQLGSLGATPTARSNVAPPHDPDDDNDPWAAFDGRVQ